MNHWVIAMIGLAMSVSVAHAASSDQAFVTQAAQGGLAEVALGEMALVRGSSASIKTFAQKMVDDHGKANQELTRIAKTAGATLPAEPSTEQKAVASKLGALSGAEFDRNYARTMVDDHEKTIALFETEVKTGANAELKAFATRTLPTLRAHLSHSKQLPQD